MGNEHSSRSGRRGVSPNESTRYSGKKLDNYYHTENEEQPSFGNHNVSKFSDEGQKKESREAVLKTPETSPERTNQSSFLDNFRKSFEMKPQTKFEEVKKDSVIDEFNKAVDFSFNIQTIKSFLQEPSPLLFVTVLTMSPAGMKPEDSSDNQTSLKQEQGKFEYHYKVEANKHKNFDFESLSKLKPTTNYSDTEKNFEICINSSKLSQSTTDTPAQGSSEEESKTNDKKSRPNSKIREIVQSRLKSDLGKGKEIASVEIPESQREENDTSIHTEDNDSFRKDEGTDSKFKSRKMEFTESKAEDMVQYRESLESERNVNELSRNSDLASKTARISFGSDMIDFTSPTNENLFQREKLVVKAEELSLLSSQKKEGLDNQSSARESNDVTDSDSKNMLKKDEKPLSSLKRQLLERKKEGEINQTPRVGSNLSTNQSREIENFILQSRVQQIEGTSDENFVQPDAGANNSASSDEEFKLNVSKLAKNGEGLRDRAAEDSEAKRNLEALQNVKNQKEEGEASIKNIKPIKPFYDANSFNTSSLIKQLENPKNSMSFTNPSDFHHPSILNTSFFAEKIQRSYNGSISKSELQELSISSMRKSTIRNHYLNKDDVESSYAYKMNKRRETINKDYVFLKDGGKADVTDRKTIRSMSPILNGQKGSSYPLPKNNIQNSAFEVSGNPPQLYKHSKPEEKKFGKETAPNAKKDYTAIRNLQDQKGKSTKAFVKVFGLSDSSKQPVKTKAINKANEVGVAAHKLTKDTADESESHNKKLNHQFFDLKEKNVKRKSQTPEKISSSFNHSAEKSRKLLTDRAVIDRIYTEEDSRDLIKNIYRKTSQEGSEIKLINNVKDDIEKLKNKMQGKKRFSYNKNKLNESLTTNSNNKKF